MKLKVTRTWNRNENAHLNFPGVLCLNTFLLGILFELQSYVAPQLASEDFSMSSVLVKYIHPIQENTR